MKTQLFNLSDCLGKKVIKTSNEYEDYVIIMFDDDTFIYLNTEYESVYVKYGNLLNQEPDINTYKDFFELGFIGSSQFNYFEREVEENKKLREFRIKEHELKELKRLKDKYEKQ